MTGFEPRTSEATALPTDPQLLPEHWHWCLDKFATSLLKALYLMLSISLLSAPNPAAHKFLKDFRICKVFISESIPHHNTRHKNYLHYFKFNVCEKYNRI